MCTASQPESKTLLLLIHALSNAPVPTSCHQDLSTYLDGDLSCGDGGEGAEEPEERARQHTVQMLHRVDVRGLI